MSAFSPRNGRFDLSSIDLHALPPEQWGQLKKQIALRARSDRNRAIRIAVHRLWRACWRLLRPRHLLAAWISHVRKRRERIAAAQLRSLSDQWLADMGLTRGQIDNCVRYRARSQSHRC
jgi:uncharacterized protein YjiS (DUF1127 family)